MKNVELRSTSLMNEPIVLGGMGMRSRYNMTQLINGPLKVDPTIWQRTHFILKSNLL